MLRVVHGERRGKEREKAREGGGGGGRENSREREKEGGVGRNKGRQKERKNERGDSTWREREIQTKRADRRGASGRCHVGSAVITKWPRFIGRLDSECGNDGVAAEMKAAMAGLLSGIGASEKPFFSPVS